MEFPEKCVRCTDKQVLLKYLYEWVTLEFATMSSIWKKKLKKQKQKTKTKQSVEWEHIVSRVKKNSGLCS